MAVPAWALQFLESALWMCMTHQAIESVPFFLPTLPHHSTPCFLLEVGEERASLVPPAFSYIVFLFFCKLLFFYLSELISHAPPAYHVRGKGYFFFIQHPSDSIAPEVSFPHPSLPMAPHPTPGPFPPSLVPPTISPSPVPQVDPQYLHSFSKQCPNFPLPKCCSPPPPLTLVAMAAPPPRRATLSLQLPPPPPRTSPFPVPADKVWLADPLGPLSKTHFP